MLAAPWDGPSDVHREWLEWSKERVRRFPAVLPEYRDHGPHIHPYVAMDELFRQLAPGDITVCGNGSACVVSFQAAEIKQGQRLWTNSGCATMGYDLPAAIGVVAATEGKQRVIAVAGHCTRREGENREKFEALVGPERRHNVVSIHSWHLDVQENEIRRIQSSGCECLYTIACFKHSVPEMFKYGSDQLAAHLTILSHQNCFHSNALM